MASGRPSLATAIVSAARRYGGGQFPAAAGTQGAGEDRLGEHARRRRKA